MMKTKQTKICGFFKLKIKKENKFRECEVYDSPEDHFGSWMMQRGWESLIFLIL